MHETGIPPPHTHAAALHTAQSDTLTRRPSLVAGARDASFFLRISGRFLGAQLMRNERIALRCPVFGPGVCVKVCVWF